MVRDDSGRGGVWTRRRFSEGATGELDGETFQLQRDGRRCFTLTSSGTVVATAEAGRRGRWMISFDGYAYELHRTSRWRSDMELCDGAYPVGSITGRPARGQVQCDLPSNFSPAVQAFIGFVVVALWNRATDSAGSTAVAVSS
ncbi:MAG: hypothetical protein JO147_15255 [Actinobacteria bacterium]|nr:hypothetical protein [Actinomycetota bacterium]